MCDEWKFQPVNQNLKCLEGVHCGSARRATNGFARNKSMNSTRVSRSSKRCPGSLEIKRVPEDFVSHIECCIIMRLWKLCPWLVEVQSVFVQLLKYGKHLHNCMRGYSKMQINSNETSTLTTSRNMHAQSITAIDASTIVQKQLICVLIPTC